jgi:ABC-2 type transport system permease protein
MRLSKAWVIAMRDFRMFTRMRSVWYSILIFPVLTSVLFPLVLQYAGSRGSEVPAVVLPQLLDAFSFFFVIGASFVPLGIASYSIVGEKVEKSLEPLLATPLTDGEILLGKTISAFLPTLASMYMGAVLFMGLMDNVTFKNLGYLYFPNWNMAILMLILIPVAITMSIEFSVIISSRVSDVRSASSYGVLMFFPFIAIYIGSEIGLIKLDANGLLLISGVIALVDVLLFFISTAAFNRELILTKWK